MLQKKVDALQKKIDHLKAQQQKIEADIAHQLLQVIKTHSGFALPFPALVGGLMEIVQICKVEPQKMEAWQQAGEKFLKSKNKGKSTSKRKHSSTPVEKMA